MKKVLIALSLLAVSAAVNATTTYVPVGVIVLTGNSIGAPITIPVTSSRSFSTEAVCNEFIDGLRLNAVTRGTSTTAGNFTEANPAKFDKIQVTKTVAAYCGAVN